MSNTKIDNIIDSLDIGDEVYIEGQRQIVIERNSDTCKLQDERGDVYNYDWGTIYEDLLTNQFENDEY